MGCKLVQHFALNNKASHMTLPNNGKQKRGAHAKDINNSKKHTNCLTLELTA
jgi:hypothetical protein